MAVVHPNEPIIDLAERIADVILGDPQKPISCNFGTEAVEGAIKLICKYTGPKEVITLEMGFHSLTLGSLLLTGNKVCKQEMTPIINDVAHASAPYGYRCPRCDGEQCDSDCADELDGSSVRTRAATSQLSSLNP